MKIILITLFFLLADIAYGQQTFSKLNVTSLTAGLSTVSSTTFPPLNVSRSTSGTSTVQGTQRLVATSSGDAADGFGPSLNFALTDTGVTAAALGTISFVRAGADDTGDFSIRPTSAGSATERLRVTSTGRVGIGTSAPERSLEVSGTGNVFTRIRVNSDTTTVTPHVEFARGGASTYPAVGSVLGRISVAPCDGTTTTCGTSSSLQFFATENMSVTNQGRDFRMFTTAKASVSNVERMRIDDDGLVTQWQPTPNTESGTTTLTAAELRTRIITYTGIIGNLTLPTGADLEATFLSPNSNSTSFDFSIINTGSGTATLVTNTGMTLVGTMTVIAANSGTFRIRRTGTNTYTVYRL